MRNIVPTVNLTLRIPKKMVDVIDNMIMNTREFTNRPDFILCSIRYLFRLVRELYKRDFGKNNPTYEMDYAKTGVVWERYEKYGKDPQLILVRVPEGMIQRWNNMRGLFVDMKTFQDFTRIAITHYIDFMIDQDYIDEIILRDTIKNENG